MKSIALLIFVAGGHSWVKRQVDKQVSRRTCLDEFLKRIQVYIIGPMRRHLQKLLKLAATQLMSLTFQLMTRQHNYNLVNK